MTLHLLECEPAGESVHVVELNVPPLPPSLQELVPVGAVAVPPLVSETVLVSVIGEESPMIADGLRGETAAVVTLRTVKEDLPELAECVASPE